MRHVPDGTLRRLEDEPFAVAERDIRHIESCERCRSRAESVRRDGQFALQRFSPVALPSPDAGWRQLVAKEADTNSGRSMHIPSRRHWRLMGASIGTGTSIAAAGVLIAGVAAAATLTTVFAPTRVAPLPVKPSDAELMSALLGVRNGEVLGGLDSPSGTRTFSFGVLSWSSSSQPRQFASLADAESAAGFTTTLPSSLPNGIGGADKYVFVPKVSATFTFNASAGATLSGSTLTMTAGPGIVVSYSGATGSTGLGSLPPMVVLATPRPTATSSGATTNELENFLLSQRGVPADLAQELRLFDNLSTTLPVPTPSGMHSASVTIDGVPGVVLSDGGNLVTGAIWEDHQGMIHVVAGLLDQKDVLGVASQIS